MDTPCDTPLDVEVTKRTDLAGTLGPLGRSNFSETVMLPCFADAIGMPHPGMLSLLWSLLTGGRMVSFERHQFKSQI